jgi:hypothetical protein
MLKVSAPHKTVSVINLYFPSCLKHPIVKPLFKKGDRENMANYRPVSLLTSFSKVFERIVYERLQQYINVNSILVEEQFRFSPATSTDKASYRLIFNK